MERFELTVSEEQSGERLDRILTQALERLSRDEIDRRLGVGSALSRSKVSGWIQSGFVQIDGQIVRKAGQLVNVGARLSLELTEPERTPFDADPTVPFQVVYEDSSVFVIDKPAGVVVHPGAGNRNATLVHGLLALGGMAADSERPGIVHRLDKDTSGLMVVARTDAAMQHLIRQFSPPRTIRRVYLALVSRLPQGGALLSGTIDLPIGRSSRDRTKMSVNARRGRESRTHWRSLERLDGAELLELTLETGRTHQIRVHLAAVGSPILGDPAYGRHQPQLSADATRALRALGRQALHAAELSFVHPTTEKELHFQSPLPPDFQALVEALRQPRLK